MMFDSHLHFTLPSILFCLLEWNCVVLYIILTAELIHLMSNPTTIYECGQNKRHSHHQTYHSGYWIVTLYNRENFYLHPCKCLKILHTLHKITEAKPSITSPHLSFPIYLYSSIKCLGNLEEYTLPYLTASV